MTLWKRNLPQKAVPKSNPAAERFRELKSEVTVVRKQGEGPVKDTGTFSRYLCDLCSTPHPVVELRQCVLCGRWGCNDCWKDDYYTCKSCAGLIAIHTRMGRD
ncbi:MAG: hypothetical protein GYA23_11795 [Methanomicrobiales archaeon]|nr:hypothetical protein [Methanomicrobiales archaeon]